MFEQKYTSVYKLLLGRISTNIADSLFYMAILWQFKQSVHSPLMVSILLAVYSGIDMISFSFGPLIDRVSIKELLKIATFVQIITSFIVAIMLITGMNNNTIINIALLGLFTLSTVASAIIYPAEYKLLPLFVSKDELLKFNGIFQVTYRILDLVLDAVVTIIITFTSVKFTIILSAMFFVLAVRCYSRLNVDKLAKDILDDEEYFTGSYFKDILVGWKYLHKEKNILLLILPLGLTNFFYGIFAVGLPYFAQDYIHDSAIGYGELLFASSVGSIIGAFLVQRFRLNMENMRLFVAICFLGAGIFRIAVPMMINLNTIVLLVASAISSTWISMMNVNFEALIQMSFSSAVLGRVQTINDGILSIMIPIGTLTGGWVVKYFGSLNTQYIYGLALLISAIYYFLVKKDN